MDRQTDRQTDRQIDMGGCVKRIQYILSTGQQCSSRGEEHCAVKTTLHIFYFHCNVHHLRGTPAVAKLND